MDMVNFVEICSAGALALNEKAYEQFADIIALIGVPFE